MMKIVKRAETRKTDNFKIRSIAILLSLLVLGMFLLVIKLNPIDVYASLIKGSFGSSYSIKQTLIKAILLIVASLGISIAFKMQFWNIGGEGQIVMGAFAATFFALKFPYMDKLPLLLIMFCAGILGGGLWALIAALLKGKWNTNETIVTLMLNYIALKFITYLQYGPWKDKRAMGFPKIPNLSPNATLPDVFGIHMGWIIAIILVIIVYIFMKYTKKGYEISVLGESEKTALYAGIKIRKTMYIAIFLSGALCGIAGVIQVSAVSRTLSAQVAGGAGFTAIIIAWLSGLSAPIIVIVSILFAALLQGASFIQTAFGIPEAAAQLIQAIILFFVLGSEFFIKYKINFNYQGILKEENRNE
ncbi:ABC transporter permease [Clostridium sp. CM028]|uniref:ABC transporter permease n=1 Tax=unclassified Clostridium TaxID=2614128 RepID=UPI001C6EF470|nr:MULTISPECIES: ABC transporter permease [unclassified Clostridium]MBW9144541.1 ABC transporter permease [Clostridium sp. CM027]MBW9147928.1 ABC transporter permease [Clostridium sp. CM028]UVE40694.1 ABC transporter permease [Clostridium sp. CM027]WLC61361.1 ABC transporter permease [Clostridium sp. CM028]